MLTCKSNSQFLFWVCLRVCLYVYEAASPKVAREMYLLFGLENVGWEAFELLLTWLEGDGVVFDMIAIRNKVRCWEICVLKRYYYNFHY